MLLTGCQQLLKTFRNQNVASMSQYAMARRMNRMKPYRVQFTWGGVIPGLRSSLLVIFGVQLFSTFRAVVSMHIVINAFIRLNYPGRTHYA
jgi:hypothetical protein